MNLQVKKLTVKRSMQALTVHLTQDKNYREAWKANIAMTFKDVAKEELGLKVGSPEVLNEIANKAADRFLDLLCKA